MTPEHPPRGRERGKPDMEIPSDRIMPGEQRLEPPHWPGGRAAAPLRAFSVIGKRNRKIEGLAKATGQALYTDDLVLPRMLHAKLLRSLHAHARIRSIDVSRALVLPGVHAVITGKDLPEYYGIIPWTQDEQALCEEKTRYVGDAVAAVAAESELVAEEALRAIVVTYEPLPAVHDLDAAIAHPEWRVNEKAKEGNVSKHVLLEFGDVEATLAASDAVVEGEYWYEGSTHTPIEPHCVIAHFDPTGFLTVWSSTQVAHYLHRDLGRVLGLPTQRIRVIQPVVGGAFGGKSEPFSLEFCAAKLSMITGRPIKILYTREEVFYAHRGRHPMRLAYRCGVRRDGTLTAVDAKIAIDGGAYSSFGLVTTYYSGQLLTAPYRMPAYRFDSTRYFTNKPCCGPKRGHGSVQPRFAFECQLDKLAEAIGMDPIELRRKNHIGENTRTVNGLRVTSNGFLDCLAAVRRSRNGRANSGGCPTGAEWAWRAACTSAARTTVSIPPRCRSRASSSSSTAVDAPPCSAAPPTSARARTRCSPTSSPRSWGSSSATSAWSLPTPISRRSTWARIRAARRSWSATPVSTPRASCGSRCARRLPRSGAARATASRSPRGSPATCAIPSGA
jgi:CO/xanthine dehydrogenase Mo-binding subunit